MSYMPDFQAHPALDSWPRQFRGRLIEPGSGVVRILRPPEARPPRAARWQPPEITTSSCRELASAVEDPGYAKLLREAADEADRQGQLLGELIRGGEFAS